MGLKPINILDAIAPELKDSSAREIHIELAEKQTGNVYRDKRNYAVALLAAHTLTVSARRGAAGDVNNVSEGQLSIGYGRVNPMGDQQLETTSYGAELVRLRKQMVMSARTIKV